MSDTTQTMTRDDVLGYLSQLTVIELAELVKQLEAQWQVSATVVAPRVIDPIAPVIEKTEFDVVLVDVGPKKIHVIKALRAMTDWSIGQAKDAVGALPQILFESLSEQEAQARCDALRDVGAVVEVR